MDDDQPQVPDVAIRFAAAGLSPDRAAEHAEAGRIRLDGVPAGLSTPAPPGTRLTLAGP